MHKNLNILKSIEVRNTKRYCHNLQKELKVLCKNGLICLKYVEVCGENRLNTSVRANYSICACVTRKFTDKTMITNPKSLLHTQTFQYACTHTFRSHTHIPLTHTHSAHTHTFSSHTHSAHTHIQLTHTKLHLSIDQHDGL